MDYRVVANLFLLLFLGIADNQMIAALLPKLVNSFHVSVRVGGLVVVVYSVGAAGAAFLSGPLSDHYGRKVFLLGGAALFALASWLSYHSGTFGGLVAARALTGLAAGTISTCSIALAGDWFPYEVRGKAIGLISSAYFAAPIVGVPLAGQVADRLGWRMVFALFSAMALFVAGLSVKLPREKANSQPSARKLRASVQALQSFTERRDLLAALGIAFLVSGGLVGFITYLGQWLNDRFQVPTGGITLVFLVGGLASLMGAPLGGILADRWGKRAVSLASNIQLAVAVALVPFLRWGPALFFGFAFTGLGAAFRQGPLTALMTEMVPGAQRGAFIALRNVCSQLGIGVAALVGGILYQSHGYFAVTSLCAAMTALVAVLLATYIIEPRSVPGRSY